MVLNNIKKRLDILELKHPPQLCSESLEDKIARYIAIMDNEDYDSSEDGRALKATIDKYEKVITELEEVET